MLKSILYTCKEFIEKYYPRQILNLESILYFFSETDAIISIQLQTNLQ